jgi:hypothetical protein
MFSRKTIIIAVAVVAVALVVGIAGYRTSLFGLAGQKPTVASTSTDQFMSIVENRQAWFDHRTIASWVASCLSVHSPENLPETYRWTLEPPGRYFNVWKEEQPNGDITLQHRAVIGLSNALFVERTDSREQLAQAFTSLQKFQVTIIVIGLLTTVFISLSSTELISESTRFWQTTKMTVKVFAIVLPAIGTAIAALNTFYDPKSDLIRYGRTLDSAGLLHRQVALGITGLSCTAQKDSDDWKKNTAQIDTWINAHKTLMSPPSQKPDATSGGDGGGVQDRAAGTKADKG